MSQIDLSNFGEFQNIVALFAQRVRQRNDAPFLSCKADGQWKSISWIETARQVAAFAKSLRDLGLEKGDRVMLVSENRPEWCIADMAIMAAGMITVPTYITNTERDHQHILDDSGARAIIVSTKKLSETLLPALMRSAHAEILIGMEPITVSQKNQIAFHDWADLVDSGNIDPLEELDALSRDITREDVACIIYTSGTGGAPRGVMQQHKALLHNAHGAGTIVVEDFTVSEEVFLSFLPLSHAYEHSGGQFLPIGLGGQIYYAEGLEKLASNIEEVRPTIMVVVPRLFEVLRQRIIKAIEKQGGAPVYLMGKALEIGAREYGGKKRKRDLPMKAILSKTLKPKISQRFGGRLKAMVSGGAPLNPDIGIFFQSLGVTVLQGYGQTESGPIISCNRPATGLKMDTVGPPLANTEVRIAEDGEILVRGDLVMKGYWRNKKETDRAIQDGWLHTGDIGYIDEAGRIAITDRKKDLIVNDKGDNVAPQKLEGMLTLQPEIIQAMVYGDKRPYMTALIVPDPDWSLEWANNEGKKFCFEELQICPAYKTKIGEAVDRVNKNLTVTEKIRRFEFAEEPFSIENEEMTPSMKIRRHMIRDRYEALLNGMYKS